MSRKIIFGGSYTSFAFEPETIAYMTALGIANDSTIYYPSTPQEVTGNGLWIAVNDFVLAVKLIGWSKFITLYPIIGGSVGRHKFNLINPLDSDLAHRLLFSGGWTFDRFGIKTNGMNCFSSGIFNPNIIFGSGFSSFGCYFGESFSSGQVNAMGCADNTLGVNIYNLGYANGTNDVFSSVASNTNTTLISDTDNKGLLLVTRQGTNLEKVFRNGALINTNTKPFYANPNQPFLWGARWAGQSALIEYFSNNQQLRFMFNAVSLSDSEVSALTTAVQNLQIALNRAV